MSRYYVRNDYGNVASSMPNNFVLHDMIGNVAEWCNDYFGPYSADSQIDPVGPAFSDIEISHTSGEGTDFYDFVKRGGGGTNATGIRLLSTTRYGDWNLGKDTGFRYVLPVME